LFDDGLPGRVLVVEKVTPDAEGSVDHQLVGPVFDDNVGAIHLELEQGDVEVAKVVDDR